MAARSARAGVSQVIAYYHRVLACDVPAFEAQGWRVVALDYSPNVGPVVLMERDENEENCDGEREGE